MTYKFCDQLKKSIFLEGSCVYHCCNCGNGTETVIVDKYKGEKLDWKKIVEQKLKFQEEAKDGKIPYKSCENCYMWREDEWTEGGYLSEISISSWTICNCNCFYCFTAEDKDFYNSFQPYKVFPILKDLQKSGFLNFKNDNGGIVRLLGGDVSKLTDADKIINFFLSAGVQNIYIPTSGIKYLPAVEKVLKAGRGEVIVSPDCANPELYKKIKRVDAYNTVRENMAKYAKSARGKSEFISKYIVIPYINDTEEEIERWLEECKNIGVRHIAYDAESIFITKFSAKIPKRLPQMFDYIERRGKEENLKVTRFRFAWQLLYDLENGQTQYTDNKYDFEEQKLFMEKFLHTYCL